MMMEAASATRICKNMWQLAVSSLEMQPIIACSHESDSEEVKGGKKADCIAKQLLFRIEGYIALALTGNARGRMASAMQAALPLLDSQLWHTLFPRMRAEDLPQAVEPA